MNKLGLIIIILLLSGCSASKSDISKSDISTSWAFDKTIIFQNKFYAGSDEKITQVGAKIGSIKHFTTNEQYSNENNTSNFYKEGTGLYEIPGTPIEKAIAVEVSPQEYVKASIF